MAHAKQAGESLPQEQLQLHFIQSEQVTEIPEDYTFFLQRNSARLEKTAIPNTETLYEWVHLSCAMWIPGPIVTPKTPVRMSKIDTKRFSLQCIICGRKTGACIQCQYSKCMISFHIECARRANYFLEIERVERERVYRVFCEKHRPLKIVKEIEERDLQIVNEVTKFTKVIEKAVDVNSRVYIKKQKQKRITPFQRPQPVAASRRSMKDEKRRAKHELLMQAKEMAKSAKYASRLKRQEERERLQAEHRASKERRKKSREATVVDRKVPKHWREFDKKMLYQRIREHYLGLIKLRMNLVNVEPLRKLQQKQERLSKRRDVIERVQEKKRNRKLLEKQKEEAKA